MLIRTISFLALLAVVIIVFSPCSSKAGDIYAVDFKNRSYQPECVSTLYDSKLPPTVTVKDGLFETKPGLGGTYFEIEKIQYEDLDRDGRKEALVASKCGFRGANYWDLEYFIYRIKDGKIEPVTALGNSRVKKDYQHAFPNSAPKSINDAAVSDGDITVEIYADGPHCCPEYRAIMIYELVGDHLKLKEKPARERVGEDS